MKLLVEDKLPLGDLCVPSLSRSSPVPFIVTRYEHVLGLIKSPLMNFLHLLLVL